MTFCKKKPPGGGFRNTKKWSLLHVLHGICAKKVSRALGTLDTVILLYSRSFSNGSLNYSPWFRR